MDDHVYKEGDRVIVPPRTFLLGRPAPGGPGTVTHVDGDVLDVTLDSGERRTPFAYWVKPEEA